MHRSQHDKRAGDHCSRRVVADIARHYHQTAACTSRSVGTR